MPEILLDLWDFFSSCLFYSFHILFWLASSSVSLCYYSCCFYLQVLTLCKNFTFSIGILNGTCIFCSPLNDFVLIVDFYYTNTLIIISATMFVGTTLIRISLPASRAPIFLKFSTLISVSKFYQRYC